MKAEQTTGDIRGRPFAKGNGGRRPGSKNRVTAVAAALLEGEEEELVRKAMELAKSGDAPMLKFLLSRILPRERRIKIDLPDIAFHPLDVLDAVFRAVGEGKISASEGAALSSLVDSYQRTLDITLLAKRLDQLEAKLKSS